MGLGLSRSRPSGHGTTQNGPPGRWGPPTGRLSLGVATGSEWDDRGPTAHTPCGFCLGIDQVAEFVSGTPAQEGRSASSSCNSDRCHKRIAQERRTDWFFNTVVGFGVVSESVGFVARRWWTRFVNRDGDSHRSSGICSEGCPAVPREEFRGMEILNATIRTRFASLDEIDLQGIFLVRACVMKSRGRTVLRCEWHCVRLTEPAGMLLVRPGLRSCSAPPAIVVASPTAWWSGSEEPFAGTIFTFRDGSLCRTLSWITVKNVR